MQTDIGTVRPGDEDALYRLLEQHHLPLDGLRDHLDTTLVARQHDHVVGSAALEIYPGGALLRSVAVAAHVQGQGLGRALTDAALRLARDRHVPAVYLLTETAERYFPKLGFVPIARTDVPATVQASAEFTSVCPVTAVVMRKTL